MITVYGVMDPRDERVVYVGRTACYKDRQAALVALSNKTNRAYNRWLHELAAIGMRPKFIVLERVQPDRGARSERKWILHHRECNPDLFNVKLPIINKTRCRFTIDLGPELYGRVKRILDQHNAACGYRDLTLVSVAHDALMSWVTQKERKCK